MKAILAVFLTEHLLTSTGEPDFLTDPQAKATIGWFTAAVYATPFLGAILSDTLLGKFVTIILLSIVYCLGHAVMALVDVPNGGAVEPRYIVYWGLALIALGAGGIKPCVSAHVGDQFGAGNKHLLSRVFGWFYFSINFGSTISTLLTPLLLVHFGPAWAFGVPGVLMGVATLAFWLGRDRFIAIPPAGRAFWTETIGPDGLRALLNLTPLLLFIAAFWSLFDQTAGAWVLQAKSMDRVVDLGFVSFEATPSQLQAINPILVMAMIPLFSYVVYPAMGRLFDVTPLRKIGIGLFVAAAAFSVSAVTQALIDAGQTPHVVWQLAGYVVLTAAEIMVSITMLEFFYTQAPPRMKAVVMAFAMFSVSIGNTFTAVVNTLIEREDGAVLL
ncbi:MAG: MFS transporter, partial [Planctomycetota bacterium]